MSVTVQYPFGSGLLVMTPRSGITAKRLVIMAHDVDGTATDFEPVPGSIGECGAALANTGYCVVAANFDPQGWGNPAAMQVIDDTITLFNGLGAVTDKIGLMGLGMGGATCLNYILNGTTPVAGSYLFSPVSDLLWAYQQPAWQLEIDSAYGSDFPNAAAGYVIAGEADRLWAANVPSAIAHPIDDPVVPYQLSVDLVDSILGRVPFQIRKPDIVNGLHTALTSGISPAEVVTLFETRADWSA